MRIVREVGDNLADFVDMTEVQKKRVGLLPALDRTRGLIDAEQHIAFMAYFATEQQSRKVLLTIAFYKVPEHVIQGVFLSGTSGNITLVPVLPRQTTPGQICFAIAICSNGAIDGGPNYPAFPSDWTVFYQDSYAEIDGSQPRQSLQLAYKEMTTRTTTPLTLSKSPALLLSRYSVWMWEIPDAGPPRIVDSHNGVI